MSFKPFFSVFISLLSLLPSALASVDTAMTVQKIVIVGNETTKDYIILREMKLQPGATITPESLEHDQKRIYSLQLFNKVELEAAPADGGRAIVVRVDERWYFFPFPILGIRYRDIDNLFYGAGVVHSNFRGRNERVFASFALGFDRWVQMAYHNPRLFDEDWFLGSQLQYARVHNLSTQDAIYEQTNFKAGLTLGKRYGLYRSVAGWVNYDLWQVSEPKVGRTASSDGRDAYVSFGGSYELDTRDIREYPTQGLRLSTWAAKYGVGGKEVDFFRYGYDVRIYEPLGSDVSVALRSFSNLAGGGIVPKYRNVYFGYDERIRGHFKTVLEGESLVGGSGELRVQLLKPLLHFAV
jgi:outer membrane protein assembly factor BamA